MLRGQGTIRSVLGRPLTRNKKPGPSVAPSESLLDKDAPVDQPPEKKTRGSVGKLMAQHSSRAGDEATVLEEGKVACFICGRVLQDETTIINSHIGAFRDLLPHNVFLTQIPVSRHRVPDPQ
jgi:hypothetical protein